MAPIEAVAAAGATFALYRRSIPFWALGLVALLMCAELWIVRQWVFVFMR
jgi:hypothetical protein